MQTFLPYPDIIKSVKCLDSKRLGKQRVEAFQILNILKNVNPKQKGWVNHPAVRMWRGFNDALAYYMNKCIDEWIRRGYNNTMMRISTALYPKMPEWFGDDRFHSSHRSNLLRKDKLWYELFFGYEKDDLPYFWPV